MTNPTTTPLTDEQLDEIEAAVPRLREYTEQSDAAEVVVTGVPALVADLRRARAQVRFLLGAMARKDTHPGCQYPPLPSQPATNQEENTMTRTLPHDPYITAVCDALTTAGLELTDHCWTDDCETRGTYCYLNAVITLDPSGTITSGDEDARDAVAWPHGLLLIWEWHTGIEAEHGEPDKGPQWLFAGLKDDGSTEYPTDLPVYGYASPAAVVEAARKVISREIGAGGFYNYGAPKWDGGVIGGSWESHAELDAACEAWGADETNE